MKHGMKNILIIGSAVLALAIFPSVADAARGGGHPGGGHRGGGHIGGGFHGGGHYRGGGYNNGYGYGYAPCLPIPVIGCPYY
jgi:uncharacterized membrane protein